MPGKSCRGKRIKFLSCLSPFRFGDYPLYHIGAPIYTSRLFHEGFFHFPEGEGQAESRRNIRFTVQTKGSDKNRNKPIWIRLEPFSDKLHAFINSQHAAVQRQMVILGAAPFHVGIEAVIGCPALILVPQAILRGLFPLAIYLNDAFCAVLHIGMDKNFQAIRLILQNEVGTAADDTAPLPFRSAPSAAGYCRIHRRKQIPFWQTPYSTFAAAAEGMT